MATYKKRGGKKDRGQAQVDTQKSTTAEVFETLDTTASKSEKWIEKNNKALFYALVGIAIIILAFLGYNKYILEPTEQEATNELAFPRQYFDKASTAPSSQVDSLLTLGLEGADGRYGFVDIATTYSGSKAGNMANYYAGVSYLKLKNYERAIEHLSKFDSDDEILGPTALGAIGDAFADINQLQEALEYYEKAAYKQDNDFTAPLFLYKAGKVALELKEYAKAETFFTKIKDDYKTSDYGKDIEKFINAAKYAQ